MPHPLPRFLSAFTARTALDTPQTLHTLTADPAETLTLQTLRVRKSLLRYPSSETDGTLVADYVPPLPAERADLAVDPDKVYYYSAFAQYAGPAACTLAVSRDVQRLHDTALGVHPHATAGRVWLVGRGAAGYSALAFDTTRGYVEGRIDFVPPERVRVSLDVHEYPAGSGQIVVFVSTDSGMRGYASTGEVFAVDYQGLYQPDLRGGFLFWAAGVLTAIYLLDGTDWTAIDPSTGLVLGAFPLSTDMSYYTGGVFRGLALTADGIAILVGLERRIVRFNPVTGLVEAYYPTRTVPHAFCEVDEGGGVYRLFVYDPEQLRILHKYVEPLPDINLTEAVDSDVNTVCLLHCETAPAGVLPDSSGQGNTGALIAPAVLTASGRFGTGINGAGTGKVDLLTLTTELSAAAGSWDFWFRTDAAAAWGGDKYLTGGSDGPVANYFNCAWNAAQSRFEVLRSSPLGLSTAIFTWAVKDTAWHHLYYQWDTAAQTHRLYLDGVAGAAVAGARAFTAPLVQAYWGVAHNGVAFPWGKFLDEYRCSTAARLPFTAYTLWRREADAHCWSGSDRTTGFQFRDQLPTAAFVPESVLDEDPTKTVSAADLVLTTGETVRRGWPATLPMGHAARLLRLLGAVCDGFRDAARNLLPPDPRTGAPEVIEALLPFLGVPALSAVCNPRTTASYSLDHQRVYLQLLPWLLPRIGMLSDGIKALCAFYGYRIQTVITLPRQHWDSGIPLDSGMPFDTATDLGRFIRLTLDLYDNDNLLVGQNDGATTIPVPGTYRFSSALGNFSTVRVGDMVRLMTSTDLGDYLVTLVVGAHDLNVTPAWPVSGNVGITYQIIPAVPALDPAAEYLRRQVSRFCPSYVEVEG